MSTAEILSAFVLDTPPGEINDVLNDVRALVDDDAALQKDVAPALAQYNTEQLATIRVEGLEYEVVISSYGHIEGDKYLDPRSKQKFTVNHAELTASDVEPADANTELEPIRSALDEAAQDYVSDHYSTGAVAVFSSAGKLAICIVANKFNPGNFCNGRWRSIWEYYPETNVLKGSFKIKVHYYEDGNVQFDTAKDVETTLESQSTPEATVNAIINHIRTVETNYQNNLNESFLLLSENTFKALRRNLPMTRNKLDWNKVVGYKIGAELANKS